ncbi:hypothetical protein ABK040_007152 [Willaertia magna]
MMSLSTALRKTPKKKVGYEEQKRSEIGENNLLVDVGEPVGPKLGASDLNSKYGRGFMRRQQGTIQQDKERKIYEKFAEERKEKKRELRENFLKQTKFTTGVNIITGENLPLQTEKYSKRIYSHHNVDNITKPVEEKRNVQREQKLASDGLMFKKDYSVKEHFQTYHGYQ